MERRPTADLDLATPPRTRLEHERTQIQHPRCATAARIDWGNPRAALLLRRLSLTVCMYPSLRTGKGSHARRRSLSRRRSPNTSTAAAHHRSRECRLRESEWRSRHGKGLHGRSCAAQKVYHVLQK
jgi:hypothetical protein